MSDLSGDQTIIPTNLVVDNVMERLAVSKQAMQQFNLEVQSQENK
jgi:hypothetical protein